MLAGARIFYENSAISGNLLFKMSLNDQFKRFKRAAARHALFTFSWIINCLPYGLVRALAYALIAVGFRLTIRQRRITMESLTIALGQEKSPEELKKIAKECFEHVGKSMVELIYFMSHPEMIRKNVFFEGKENLEKALKGGKGVIAISAHFGNFPLMLIRCAQEGYKTNAIIRSTRDQKIEAHFQNLRTRLGLHTIYSHPRKACVDTSLRVLRNNEFLFIPLDQNFGSDGGVFVVFFGQKAAPATGPAVFSMRTGPPLLTIFVVRQNDDTHKIIIEPPLFLEEKESDQETILANTARITQIIERYIRRYPAEWGWMHRRWKTRPGRDISQN